MAVASTGRRHLTPGSRKVSNVTMATRAVPGTGGLVMQGFTVKLRRGGVGSHRGPKLRAPGAGTLKGSGPDANTVLRRPTLRPGKRAALQAGGRAGRGSTSRPVLGPMRTKARTIIP